MKNSNQIVSLESINKLIKNNYRNFWDRPCIIVFYINRLLHAKVRHRCYPQLTLTSKEI